MKTFKLTVSIFLALSIFSMNIFAENLNTGKRIYISNLERKNDISEDIKVKIRDIIKITILEKYGDSYRIISDEDIKIMFKQAESLQALENKNQNTTLNIAEAINADEIIYGTVSRENNQIRINVSNLETGSRQSKYKAGTKSIVSLVFEEKDLDWMAREASIKLMDPKYRIIQKTNVMQKIEISEFEVNVQEKKDLQKYKFSASESNLTAILEYYKEIMKNGDEFYEQGKIQEARNKYKEIISSADQKMSSENKIKLESFLKVVREKISITVKAELKPQIEAVDSKFISNANLTEKDINKILSAYNTIRKKLPSIDMTDSDNAGTIKALDQRNNAVVHVLISAHENKGDTYYNNYKFKEALAEYEESIKQSKN